MMDRKENLMLKAATGLEGGVVASGSTCGVITGGALGLALLHEKEIQEKGVSAEIAVHKLIGDYIKWFEGNFGSTLCRQRSGVDFYTKKGQLRYLLPGDRVCRCLWHIGKTMHHLYPYQEKYLPIGEVDKYKEKPEPLHCAKAVLKGVRERTGFGDASLENLSFVFDGGVGLTGGVCGALAGSILAINLFLGMNIRHMGYPKTIKGFFAGHLNLLKDKEISKPEPFAIGSAIVKRFRHKTGKMECREIIGKTFHGWDDFQKHMASSHECKDLIKFATDAASEAIDKWR
jgi:C_GCAxxG_C_C family probable redox protein